MNAQRIASSRRSIGALLATSARSAIQISAEPDLAYAEYQRGRYVGAFKEAMRRVEEKSDPKSMTLLGELYADGLGVPNDDKKAAEWYKLAAARGDREAMFALSMFKMTGRGGPADRPEAVRLLTEAAKRGHVVAAYDLALLYLEGQTRSAGFQPRRRADAPVRRRRQSAGAIRAGHVLQGRPRRDERPRKKPLVCSAPRRAPATPRPRSNTASRCSTAPASPRTRPPPPTISSRRQRRATHPRQNRLALMYATGRGIKADPVEAGRWHLIARAGGDNDQYLDDFMRNMKPADRTMGENKAKPWIARMNPIGPTPFPTAPPNPTKSQTVKP